MQKIAKILFVLGAISLGIAPAHATEPPVSSEVVLVTQLEDGSTNTWTQADLVQALGLLNRKYHRDCKSPSGRKAWHGKISKEIINEDTETKTEVYEDGTQFSYKFRIVTPIDKVQERNKNYKNVITNGIPASLAKARLRRQAEKVITNIVNQVLKAGE